MLTPLLTTLPSIKSQIYQLYDGLDQSIRLYVPLLLLRSFWRGDPDPSSDQTEHGRTAGQPAEGPCPYLCRAAGVGLSRGHWKVRRVCHRKQVSTTTKSAGISEVNICYVCLYFRRTTSRQAGDNGLYIGGGVDEFIGSSGSNTSGDEHALR